MIQHCSGMQAAAKRGYGFAQTAWLRGLRSSSTAGCPLKQAAKTSQESADLWNAKYLSLKAAHVCVAAVELRAVILQPSSRSRDSEIPRDKQSMCLQEPPHYVNPLTTWQNSQVM